MARALMALSPATLNFLSGLSAGAGINMLTSVATDPDISSIQIIADSTLWVVAAGLLTAVATTTVTMQAEVEQATTGLTHDEISGVRASVNSTHRMRLQALSGAAVLALVLAAVLVPNLMPWRQLGCVLVDCADTRPTPTGSPSPGRGN
jgi:hypothetical protein